MKFFDLDWQSFLERMRTWHEISTASRAAYLELRFGVFTNGDRFGADLHRLVAEKLLSLDPAARRVCIADQARDLAAALRAMARHPLMSPSREALLAYLREHFEKRETQNLVWHYGNESVLVDQVVSEQWLCDCLAEDAAERLCRGLFDFGRTPDVSEILAAQALVREAQHWRDPVELFELPERVSSVPASRLGKALEIAIRLLLLFPRLRQDDRIPVIGLWPSVAAWLHRPLPAKPGAVEPGERFQMAYRVIDMTTFLVAAASGPVRVRAHDRHLFEKAVKEIGDNLVPLPSWLAGVDASPAHRRIDQAQELLSGMGLISLTRQDRRVLGLEPTGKAQRWLAATDEGRIRQVVRHLKPVDRPSIPGYYYDDDQSQDLRRELGRRAAQAFADSAGDHFADRDEFLQWHTEVANPLVEKVRQGGSDAMRLRLWWRTPTPVGLRQAWTAVLDRYLREFLLPLGGVEFGTLPGDRFCFRLTEVGRFVLGLTDEFSYCALDNAAAEIVVQPNFEIVFLSPSPLAEATLARCADRTRGKADRSTAPERPGEGCAPRESAPGSTRRTASGHRGVGALFKITKASIFAAAATGMTADEVISSLSTLSKKPLPANVQREIEGWFQQCRRVTLGRAVLIRCPDADTAARVVSASGGKAKLITDTVLELQDPESQLALVKKLKTLGIFVQVTDKTEKEIPDFF